MPKLGHTCQRPSQRPDDVAQPGDRTAHTQKDSKGSSINRLPTAPLHAKGMEEMAGVMGFFERNLTSAASAPHKLVERHPNVIPVLTG